MCVWPPPRVPAPPPGSRCGRGDIGAAGGGGGGTDRRMCVLPFFGGGGVMLRGDPPTPLCLPPPLGQVPWPGGVPSRPVPPPRVSPRFVFSLIIPIPRLRGGGGGVDPGGEETPLPPIQPQNVTPSSCARSFGVTGWGLGVKGGVISTPKPRRVPGTCPGDAGRDEDPGPQSLGSPHPTTSPGTHPLFCTPKQRRRACTHPPFLLSAGKKGVTPLEGPLGDGCCRPPPMIPGPFWGKTKIND